MAIQILDCLIFIRDHGHAKKTTVSTGYELQLLSTAAFPALDKTS